MAPTLFDVKKWRPTFTENHIKTFFGGHIKKGLHDLHDFVGENL